MKTKKRVISMFLILTMLSCLVACGNSTPAIGNDVVSTEESTGTESSEAESTEASTEIVESSSAETTKEDSTEVKAEDTETTETKPTEEPTTTPAVPTSTPTPATPTPEPHVHEYTETVTRKPNCAEAGEKVLTCSCGDSKTEAIPATGNHNWVEGTTVIHHEALGHIETIITQTGVGETRHEYECANCGARFDTPEAKVEHCKSTGDRNHATCGTIIHDIPGEPIYEETQVWIVDQEAWDEEVPNGTFTCSVCGATK